MRIWKIFSENWKLFLAAVFLPLIAAGVAYEYRIDEFMTTFAVIIEGIILLYALHKKLE